MKVTLNLQRGRSAGICDIAFRYSRRLQPMARSMTRLAASAFALVIFGLGVLGCPAEGTQSPSQPPLNSIAAIHALSNAEAAKGLPVSFQGSVIYYKHGDFDLFIQDGDTAVYVETGPNWNFVTGDRVQIVGKTHASFRPEVISNDITLLHHGDPPPPVQATFRQLIRAELDARRAQIRATVSSANIVKDAGIDTLYLELLMDGGSIEAEVSNSGPIDLEKLIDAQVDVTGAVAGKFDGKMQMLGVLLEIPSMADVKIISPASTRPADLPVTRMDEILKNYGVRDQSQRVRVEGTLTYYQPGSELVLQDGNHSLRIRTQFEKPLRIGDQISATGFPDVYNGALALTRAEIEDTGKNAALAPQATTAEDLGAGTRAFDLISVEGVLLSAVKEAAQDEYFLNSNGHLFTAVYRHPRHGALGPPLPFKDVPEHSRVRMTGICIPDTGDRLQGPVTFEVLLRSPDDITVVADPSPLNVKNLMILVGVLLVVVLAIAAREWMMERRVRTQSAELANVERRRSRILEDINGSRPLPEILEHITELASCKLQGAACWCDLADGSQHGNRPKSFSGLRIVEAPLKAPSGDSLGFIFAAFHQLSNPVPAEFEGLAMCAGLAVLAIETRRLYTDLRHRSEFDLLTDIHNRFSLEKRLDEMLMQSKITGRPFGLIYVDLDGFKAVNDVFGHQVGDRYLQMAALRMQRQIRPADMLARLGGDEFAVLVPDIRGEGDLKEITARIESCFKRPFVIAGNQVRGAASMGFALYPADGMTKDRLLNAADAAMYVTKNANRTKVHYEMAEEMEKPATDSPLEPSR